MYLQQASLERLSIPIAPSYQLGVRYPKLAILIRGIHVFASQGIEALTCKYRREDAFLACVQDIRPHVPELGCTSAVQNEKYIFSFLYCPSGSYFWFTFVVFMYLQSQGMSLDLARGRVAPHLAFKTLGPTLGFDTPSWQYFLFVVFMYLQVKASSLDLQMPTRGRVAPKLACVQDIRPHVPELGCTSAVQAANQLILTRAAEH